VNAAYGVMAEETLLERPFRWRDGERLIVFGRGVLEQADELIGADGYTLLTTARAASLAPEIAQRAGAVHDVAEGRVDELAAGLRSEVEGEVIVALGGGRVIDTAKALAAADPPCRVAAIPTTLSGAEMTNVHMHVAGVAATTPRVRPAIVINDPWLCASQPPASLAQSAANALGHAAEGPLTPLQSTVTTLAALQAAHLIATAFAPGALMDDAGAGDEAARDKLALAALLAGYVIGSTWYGLHHVVSQTLRGVAGLAHAEANAIMLPHTLAALARRNPAYAMRLSGALREEPTGFALRLGALGGVTTLRQAGVDETMLDACVERAASRPELAMTPPAADREELRALYEAAM
jgi:alcohol dehydrogenase class IV